MFLKFYELDRELSHSFFVNYCQVTNHHKTWSHHINSYSHFHAVLLYSFVNLCLDLYSGSDNNNHTNVFTKERVVKIHG